MRLAPVPSRRKARGEAAGLARALANTSRATLIVFYSEHCPLCKSLQEPLERADASAQWLDVVNVGADDFEAWAPEMLRYDVQQVPCLVLLDRQGVARLRGSARLQGSPLQESASDLVACCAAP